MFSLTTELRLPYEFKVCSTSYRQTIG